MIEISLRSGSSHNTNFLNDVILGTELVHWLRSAWTHMQCTSGTKQVQKAGDPRSTCTLYRADTEQLHDMEASGSTRTLYRASIEELHNVGAPGSTHTIYRSSTEDLHSVGARGSTHTICRANTEELHDVGLQEALAPSVVSAQNCDAMQEPLEILPPLQLPYRAVTLPCGANFNLSLTMTFAKSSNTHIKLASRTRNP